MFIFMINSLQTYTMVIFYAYLSILTNLLNLLINDDPLRFVTKQYFKLKITIGGGIHLQKCK